MTLRACSWASVSLGAVTMMRASYARGDVPGAAPTEVSIVWQAPSECANADWLRGRVRELRGPRPLPPLQVRGNVTREEPDRWRLLLVTTSFGQPGERVVEGPSCQSVTESAALILALFDDKPASPTDPAPGAVASPEAAATTNTPFPIVAPLFVAPQLGVDVGTAAAVRPAGFLGVGWRSERVRIEAAVDYAFSRALVTLDQVAPTQDFSVLRFGLRGCPTWRRSHLAWHACAGLEGGTISMGSMPNLAPADRFQTWIAITAGPLLTWQLAPAVALRAQLDMLLPLTQARFPYAAGGTYKMSPVSGRILAGAEFYF